MDVARVLQHILDINSFCFYKCFMQTGSRSDMSWVSHDRMQQWSSHICKWLGSSRFQVRPKKSVKAKRFFEFRKELLYLPKKGKSACQLYVIFYMNMTYLCAMTSAPWFKAFILVNFHQFYSILVIQVSFVVCALLSPCNGDLYRAPIHENQLSQQKRQSLEL